MDSPKTTGTTTSIPMIDAAILVEAHGLIEEMLSSDHNQSCPPHILTGLKAIGAMLEPVVIASTVVGSTNCLANVAAVGQTQKSGNSTKKRFHHSYHLTNHPHLNHHHHHHHHHHHRSSHHQHHPSQEKSVGNDNLDTEDDIKTTSENTKQDNQTNQLNSESDDDSDVQEEDYDDNENDDDDDDNEDNDDDEEEEDCPYIGERTISILPKKQHNKRIIPLSLMRRMSTSTWTTTTSATGLPTLEPEPRCSRTISASLATNNGSSSNNNNNVKQQRNSSFRCFNTKSLIPKRCLNPLKNRSFSAQFFPTESLSKALQQQQQQHHQQQQQQLQKQQKINEKQLAKKALGLCSGKDCCVSCCGKQQQQQDVAKTRTALKNLEQDQIGSSQSPQSNAASNADNKSIEALETTTTLLYHHHHHHDPTPIPPQTIDQSNNRSIGTKLLNLTSDYDSCNESPTNSVEEVTFDEAHSFGSIGTTTSRHKSSNECQQETDVLNNQNHKQTSSPSSSLNQSRKAIEISLTRPMVKLDETAEIKADPHLKEMFQDGTIKEDKVLINTDNSLVMIESNDDDDDGDDRLLSKLYEWDYPIFDLFERFGDRILSSMLAVIFNETNLMEVFRIPSNEFHWYFRALENGYHQTPYHNRMHAADVLHGVYYLTSRPIPDLAQTDCRLLLAPSQANNSQKDQSHSCLHSPSHSLHLNNKSTLSSSSNQETLNNPCCSTPNQNPDENDDDDEEIYGILAANYTALELMALYTAAAMHDYDHPGRTNAFLVSTNSNLAIFYNDRSVLENHHAAAAWNLFFSETKKHNWLKNVDRAEFKRFRYLVIELILATDLKRHFEILTEFRATVDRGIDWESESDRLLVFQNTIKLADINGPCKTHSLHLEWTKKIAEEFYEQGDEESKLGLPISPYMDRRNPQLAKLQESFINHLVAPLCNAYEEAGLFPRTWSLLKPIAGDDENETKQDDSAEFPTTQQAESEKQQKTKSNEKQLSKCIQSIHLKENYEFWIKQLMTEKSRRDSLERKNSSEFKFSPTSTFARNSLSSATDSPTITTTGAQRDNIILEEIDDNDNNDPIGDSKS